MCLIVLSAQFYACYRPNCPSEETILRDSKPVHFTYYDRLRIPYKNLNKLTFLVNDTLTVVYTKTVSKYGFKADCRGTQGDCIYIESDCRKYEFEEYVFDAPSFEKISLKHYLIYPFNNYNSKIRLTWDNMHFENRADFLDTLGQYENMNIGNKNYTNIYLILLKSDIPSTDSVYFNKEFGIVRIKYSDGTDLKLLGVQ